MSEENYLKAELYQSLKNDNFIFDFIQDNTLDGLWYWDLEHPENEFMNEKFWKVLGYNPSKMPHSPEAWQNIINQDDLALAIDNFNKHCENPNHPYNQTVRYTHKNGSTVWVICKGVAIRDNKGVPKRMLGVHINVTELKNTEKSLKIEKEKLEAVLSGSKLGAWEWDIPANKLSFSNSWPELYGFTKEELANITTEQWINMIEPTDFSKAQHLINEHLSKNTSYYECEFRVKHKNGHWIWIRDKGKVAIKDSNGNPIKMYGMHKDISEEYLAKKQLQEEKERLFNIIEAAELGTWELNITTSEFEINDKWAEVLGYTKQEIAPITFQKLENFTHPDDFKGVIEQLENHIKGNTDGFTPEVRMKHKNGSWIWLQLKGKIIKRDEQGKPLFIFGTQENIEFEKNAKNKLKEQKDRLNYVIEGSNLGTWEWNVQTNETIFNERWAAIVGYTLEELAPLSINTWAELTHPEDLKKAEELLDKHFKGENEFYELELRMKHKNGHWVWIKVSGKVRNWN